jgi:toxin ParE1/3/4
VRERREQCRRLAAFPEAARLRPDLGEGVRLSVSGNYVIPYVMHLDLMEIRRMVHGARNLTDID